MLRHWPQRGVPALGALLFAMGLVMLPARAETVLARVQQRNAVTCAAPITPGFAARDGDGTPAGLAVDLCRAVAMAVLGPSARTHFRLLPRTASPALLTGTAAADLTFLPAWAAASPTVAARLIPGPVVFIDPITVLVPQAARARAPTELGGALICLLIGSSGERALEASLATLRPPIGRLAFREADEMADAFDSGACDAVVGSATSLAALRAAGHGRAQESRLLAPPLALVPILAFTPARDGAWAALVGWVLRGLIASDLPPSPWQGEAAAAVAGLRPHWQREVRARLGSYGAMRERALGAGSPLRLGAWPNAPWPQGLLLAAPAN